MVADKNAKVSNMFRFGMQLVMPKSYENISYYGRGPIENYSNRNHCTDLGIYNQTVDDSSTLTFVHRKTVLKQISAGGNN